VFRVVLGIAPSDVERQTVHFLPDLDAKGTGLELVKGERAALLVYSCLLGGCTLERLGAARHFP